MNSLESTDHDSIPTLRFSQSLDVSSMPIACRISGRIFAGLLATALLSVAARPAAAQVQVPRSGKYFPLDQTVQPGKAGMWSVLTRRDPVLERGYFQPIRVEVPGTAKVTFYAGSPEEIASAPAPASAAFLVGRLYRLKISNIAEFPGLELFPTVELLDRLHPPAGKASNYPIPLTITEEEIESVLQGRLVTKVVYLEQPTTAYVGPSADRIRNLRADPHSNALAIADQHGRPMAIVRIGGRVPVTHGEDDAFYGSGAPVKFPADTPFKPAAVKP